MVYRISVDPNLRLKKTNQAAITAASDPGGLGKKKKFSNETEATRLASLYQWYEKGGEHFLSWVREHYRTHSGIKLTWDKCFLEEVVLVLGNPWLEDVWLEKSAQVGWSELAIALMAFWLSEVRIPCAYGVEQASKLGDMIGPRVQTAFDYCEPIQRLKTNYLGLVGRKDTDTKQRQMSVGGISATFFYTGRMAAKSKGVTGNERQASSAISSFVAHAVIADEAELWPPQSIDIAKKRMESVTNPTRPFRAGSTPGHKGGVVDRAVEGATYLFQWQLTCDHCGKDQFIHPFGNLLKGVTVVSEGKTELAYLDRQGKPLEWFHTDGSSLDRRIKTAYVGCIHCAKELTYENLIKGEFRCRNTKISARDLCARTIENREVIRETVAMRVPKICVPGFSAADRIGKLITTRNIVDELQQGLGLPVSIGGGRINIEILLSCTSGSPPTDPDLEELIVMGVDQGKVAHVLILERWLLPLKGDPQQRWEKAFVEVLDWQELGEDFTGLEDYALKNKVSVIGIDSDPETSAAGKFARAHPPHKQGGDYSVYLFDQVSLSGGQKFRRVNQTIQGVEVPIYRLDRTAGLDAIRDRVYNNLLLFPSETYYDPKDSGSIFYQFLVSERLDNGTWTAPPGEPDHFFHARNFAEMSVLAHLLEPRDPELVFASIRTDVSKSKLKTTFKGYL